MPAADLRAMLQLADAINARERVNAVNDGLAASGWTKKEAVSRHLRALERRANLVSETAAQAPQRAPMKASELRASGLEIVRVPKRG